MSAPAAILVLLISLVLGVWLTTTALAYLRRNVEANERIATALEAANAQRGAPSEP